MRKKRSLSDSPYISEDVTMLAGNHVFAAGDSQNSYGSKAGLDTTIIDPELLDLDASAIPSLPANGDSETRYALQFLTYAYSIPFRRLALQQELSDVFGFSGIFDEPFLGRWDALTPPERAAFCQSYRELRRMEALGDNFDMAEQESAAATLEDKAGRFVAAHMDGLDRWQDDLRNEAETAARRSPRAAAVLTDAPSVPAPAPLQEEIREVSLLTTLPKRDNQQMKSTLEGFFPIDDLAHAVLEEMSSKEVRDAQGRFLARVRWLLALPNQQRMAVALRTIGKKRREIAETLGIADDAVKALLARADADWESLSDAQKSIPSPSRDKVPRKRRSGAVG